MSACDHPKLSVIGVRRDMCAHPSCVNGFAGEAMVTMEALPTAASSIAFTTIYLGPGGVPVHGRPGCIRRTYPRIRDVDGWRFGDPKVEVMPAVSAEEMCRAAWDK